ncbi:hypothetical protein ACIA5C_47685 [Actinoplanes sp. NPDC051343]|uniref:hypothetical protein n=1 Tax=Actinoplanes sp. NPDC051343 TaxID=3363906 RepID=UPI00379B8613
MAQPATSNPGRTLVLSLAEARIRFAQLARLASVNQQITVVTDGGRQIAVIAPAHLLHGVRTLGERPSNPDTTQGWIRRIESARAEVRRQLEQRTTQLEQALEEAWQLLDAHHPAGTDRNVDTMRVLHADVRRAR